MPDTTPEAPDLRAFQGSQPAPQAGMKSYWLTKYALSGGIEIVDGVPSRHWTDAIEPMGYSSAYRLGTDIFDNEADARKDANARRLKKIASLRKQIAKLEKLEF